MDKWALGGREVLYLPMFHGSQQEKNTFYCAVFDEMLSNALFPSFFHAHRRVFIRPPVVYLSVCAHGFRTWLSGN
jgi:hypothetical protein